MDEIQKSNTDLVKPPVVQMGEGLIAINQEYGDFNAISVFDGNPRTILSPEELEREIEFLKIACSRKMFNIIGYRNERSPRCSTMLARADNIRSLDHIFEVMREDAENGLCPFHYFISLAINVNKVRRSM